MIKAKINRYNPENKTRKRSSGMLYYSTKPVIDDVQIWEGTEEEIFKVIFQLVDSTARLGSENAFNGLVGASEVVGEGSSEGLLRMFGYSKLTAEKMTGNK